MVLILSTFLGCGNKADNQFALLQLEYEAIDIAPGGQRQVNVDNGTAEAVVVDSSMRTDRDPGGQHRNRLRGRRRPARPPPRDREEQHLARNAVPLGERRHKQREEEPALARRPIAARSCGKAAVRNLLIMAKGGTHRRGHGGSQRK